MNVYVCIRLVLHCLLFLFNLSALTTASWFITVLNDQGQKATAGSVLVILGSIFYALATVCLYSELFISGSKYSKNKNETYAVPVLFGFQFIGAVVSTAEASGNWSSCEDQSLSVALVIFSWMSTFALVIYFLIIMIVGFYHYVLDENVWDATPLAYNWFPLPISSEKSQVPSQTESSQTEPVNPSLARTEETASEVNRPSATNYVDLESGAPNAPLPTSQPVESRATRRPLSSWMPTPVDISSKTLPHLLPRTTADITSNVPDYLGSGTNVNVPKESDESDPYFTEIALTQDDPVPGSSSVPSNPTNSDDARDSFLPAWVKRMRPAIRGVGLPFPVASTSTRTRPLAVGKRDIRRLDAPVSPTPFPE